MYLRSSLCSEIVISLDNENGDIFDLKSLKPALFYILLNECSGLNPWLIVILSMFHWPQPSSFSAS